MKINNKQIENGDLLEINVETVQDLLATVQSRTNVYNNIQNDKANYTSGGTVQSNTEFPD